MNINKFTSKMDATRRDDVKIRHPREDDSFPCKIILLLSDASNIIYI